MKIRTAIVATVIGSAGLISLPSLAQTAPASRARAMTASTSSVKVGSARWVCESMNRIYHHNARTPRRVAGAFLDERTEQISRRRARNQPRAGAVGLDIEGLATAAGVLPSTERGQRCSM